MSGTLAHRGPDGEGVHLDGPVALGHRRLSIIDLSEAASEPMTNEDGSLWLVFNGEIYNFRELRRSLEGRHRFKSQGDGEVILHLYAEKGDAAVVGARRHVRLRALGRAQAAPAARARPRGQEAALLPRRAAALRVRLRGEGAPRAPGGPARARPRGAAAVPDLRLRADAGDLLPRDPRAAAGAHAGGDRGGNRGAPGATGARVSRAAGRIAGRPGARSRAPSQAR